MELRQYQELAADRLFGHDATILDAQMGSGKTATALVAMRDLLDECVVSRFLVLAPVQVCNHVWGQEAAKWTPDLVVAIATGNPRRRREALTSSAQVVVLNFENIAWAAKEGLLDAFDGILIDELTKMKSTATHRYRALRRVMARAKVRIGMTGTLSSQGLEDLYGQVTLIDNGERFGRSFDVWRNRWLMPPALRGGRWKPQPGAEAELLPRLRGLVYSIDPTEYRRELPPIVTTSVTVDLPAPARDLYTEMEEYGAVVLPDGTDVDVTRPGVDPSENQTIGIKLRQIAAGFLYDDDEQAHHIHDAKIDAAADLIEGMPSVLVFYQFEAELDALLARTPGVAFGRAKDRAQVIDDWNAGRIPVLYAHPDSAGHGLNLQFGGHHVLWTSLPWSWDQYHQARDRIHRGGQTNTVFEHIILAEGTIDEAVLRTIQSGDAFAERVSEAVR